jgi:pilus assembly protein Flp/PilA
MIRRILSTGQAWLFSFIPEREDGQGMAEYGLILAGVAVLAIIAVFALGGKLGNMINKINSSLS